MFKQLDSSTLGITNILYKLSVIDAISITEAIQKRNHVGCDLQLQPDLVTLPNVRKLLESQSALNTIRYAVFWFVTVTFGQLLNIALGSVVQMGKPPPTPPKCFPNPDCSPWAAFVSYFCWLIGWSVG